jgi:hypothetical protein
MLENRRSAQIIGARGTTTVRAIINGGDFGGSFVVFDVPPKLSYISVLNEKHPTTK